MSRNAATALVLDGENKTFAAVASKGMKDELGGRGSDPDFFGLLAILPDPDEILRRSGKDLKAFKRILSDEHVESVTSQRSSAVLRKKWEVLPGGDSPADKAAAEMFKEVLENLNMQMVRERILAGTGL